MKNRITTHPGDVLKEELEARGISQKKFSEVLSVPYTQLNEILNGKRPVTTDFALMMEAARVRQSRLPRFQHETGSRGFCVIFHFILFFLSCFFRFSLLLV